MKKRIVALLLILCLVVALVPAVSATEVASGTCGENLTWVLTEDGTLTISGEGLMYDYSYKAPWTDQSASIKNAVINSGVTRIGENAFYYCSNLKQVSIPSSVTSIGSRAFFSCSSLSEISIPEGVMVIDNQTFSDCLSLEKITLPSRLVSIGYDAFNHCSSLKEIDIPNTVSSIDSGAFTGCTSLTKIKIPNGITSISSGLFRSCTNVTEILLPDSITTIGNQAFVGCSNLVELHIPNSVTEMGESIFDSCKNLQVIHLSDNLTQIPTYCFYNCASLANLTIPSSVTYINYEAFIGCDNLSTVFFVGDAPKFNQYAFSLAEIYCFYPSNNTTWTADILQNYGGIITWVPYNPNNPFTDVPEDSFYYEPVLWALENGITTGASETSFNPNGQCLRAQVVTFLHRAAENPEPTAVDNPFTDVKSTDFFYKPVLWAVEEGITNGVSATRFGSFDVCNRAAVVTFLWRAAGQPEPESADNPFTDVKETDFFYKPVLWAVEKGITNGISATEFGPTAACNRAQVVTFLYRAYH